MSDYIKINNYSGLGQIGISRDAIAAIASSALKEVDGVGLFSRRASKAATRSSELSALLSIIDGVKVVFTKEGRAVITLDVSITTGVNVVQACEKIQESVAMAVSLMCDILPFDVRVKVVKIV